MRVTKKFKQIARKRTAKKRLVEDPLKKEHIAKKTGSKVIQITRFGVMVVPSKKITKSTVRKSYRAADKVVKSTARGTYKVAVGPKRFRS